MNFKTVKLITFGLGGHTEYYSPIKTDWGGLQIGYLSGYDRPHDWSPDKGVDYSDCLVIDLRDTVTKNPEYSLRGPMYSTELTDGSVSYLLNVVKPKPGALDLVARDLYVRYWMGCGAVIGTIQNGKILWTHPKLDDLGPLAQESLFLMRQARAVVSAT